MRNPRPLVDTWDANIMFAWGDLVPKAAPSAELPGIKPSIETKHKVKVLTYDMSSFSSSNA